MLIAIGVAVFIVGASLAFLAVRSGKDDTSPRLETAATTPATTPGQVTATGGTAPSFEIPTGKQAVAVQVPYVQGVAGYLKAGDKINVFGTVKPGAVLPKGQTVVPLAKLILSDVQVLSVTSAGPGAPTTVVLALNANDAEQVIYIQSFDGLYLSHARSVQGIVSAPGHTAGQPF
jgi:hypothetical protein